MPSRRHILSFSMLNVLYFHIKRQLAIILRGTRMTYQLSFQTMMDRAHTSWQGSQWRSHGPRGIAAVCNRCMRHRHCTLMSQPVSAQRCSDVPSNISDSNYHSKNDTPLQIPPCVTRSP